jgi:hypothetical protein
LSQFNTNSFVMCRLFLVVSFYVFVHSQKLFVLFKSQSKLF